MKDLLQILSILR